MSAVWRRISIALGVFVFALLCLFHGLFSFDPTQYVLAEIEPQAETRWDRLAIFDLHFGVAMTSRNAYTLVNKPWDLFQLEQCHPQENALALGEPMVAQGILGIPGWLVSGDPLVTFSSVVLIATLIGALAMYILVAEWTEVPAAGVAAGLLYGFHAIKIGDTVHFFVWDMAWTAIVLLCLRRLFEAPRWRDAALLTAAGGMQIVGSIYPMISGILVGIPVFVWLVIHYGVERIPWRHLGVVAACGIGLAIAMYSPYLALRDEGTLTASPFYAYLAFSWLAPGARFYLGWMLPLLAVAGVVGAGWVGGARPVPNTGVRFALLAAVVATLWLAAGGTSGDLLEAIANDRPTRLPEVFNPWPVLLALLPGLDVVRSPAALLSGVHFGSCLLAGFGVAALVRAAPERWERPVAAALVLLAFVDTIRPAFLGMEPRIRYAAIQVAPDPALLRAFEELERGGNQGPVFEVWLDRPQNLSDKARQGEGALLTAYHHRRSSTCYNSFMQAEFEELQRLERAIAAPASIARLRALGFTTVLIHHKRMFAVAQRTLERVDALASGEDAVLEKRYAADSVSVYEIREAR